MLPKAKFFNNLYFNHKLVEKIVTILKEYNGSVGSTGSTGSNGSVGDLTKYIDLEIVTKILKMKIRPFLFYLATNRISEIAPKSFHKFCNDISIYQITREHLNGGSVLPELYEAFSKCMLEREKNVPV